jgi:hypothetical protein
MDGQGHLIEYILIRYDSKGGEWGGVRVMVLSDTFTNISVILWRSVLLVEENLSNQGTPPTCGKSLTNFIT